ncbi:hypothetical protein D3C85_1239960 [compost metagenome]
MGLHIAHAGAGGLGQALQRADLVDHIGRQLIAGHVHVASAKAHFVRVSDMGTNGDVFCRCSFQCPQDTGRVAGVKTAGDIGAGHDIEHRGIVAHVPGAKAFTQVAVDIYGWH